MSPERRELGEMAPIRAALSRLEEQQKAAATVKDARLADVLGEVRATLASAIDEAVRPPSGGISVDEYAERHELNRWTVYKAVQQGRIRGARKRGGRIVLPPNAELEPAA
jgi:hypothetical protein